MTEFVVRVPPDTPPDAFLCGDGDALGRWTPWAVRLEPWGDRTRRARLALPPGRVRYAVTLGRWRAVEGTADGHEVAVRELDTFGPTVVDVRVAGWGRTAVRYHADIRSPHLPHARPISVWLPPGYDLDRDRRYPVFYLHDGQNLFDAETAFAGNPWRADETADVLARTGEIEPVILVGVGNSPDRLDEYGPRRGHAVGPDLSAGYGRFLVEELKPFIDREYRTRPGPTDTAVGGSSMGGLISLHLARWHPEVFGKCAAVSPSLWWEREHFLRTVRYRTDWVRHVKIWLDMGTREGHTEAGMVAGARRARHLAAAFEAIGRRPGRDFYFLEIDGGGHSEHDWAMRFDRVLKYLFPAPG